MNKLTLPIVNFSNQAVISNYPEERYEAIVVTHELIEFAKFVLPQIRIERDFAKGIERLAIHNSSGESSWRRNEGLKKSIRADKLTHVVNLLELLQNGKNSNSWSGWIDRSEWNSIVSVIKSFIEINE